MNSIFISSDDWLSLVFRLSLAVLVGGVVGWNREMAGKAAGLRTQMLVSLGSALFVLALLLDSTAETSSVDPLSHALQGVATGVGFLGAGEILQQPREDSNTPMIKGLTSAASVWVAAALGVVSGCGFWQVSLMGAVLTLLILTGVERIENLTPTRQDDNS